MIYVFTLFLIVYCSHILRPDQYSTELETGICYTKARLKYNLIIGGWFLLLLTLRNDYVGTDTQNYHMIFENFFSFVTDFSFKNAGLSSDIGFYSLVYWLQYYGCPFRFLLFISAFVYIAAIVMLIYKYSKKSWLSYFIFLTFGFFIFNTTMRQCFAVSFCIFAFEFAVCRKFVPYLILVLLAISFHSTAVVFLPVYWITRFDYKKRYYIIIAIVALFLASYASAIFSYALLLTEKKYEVMETGGYGQLFITIAISVVGFLNRNNLPYSSRYWLLFSLITIALFPLGNINPAFFRIDMYYEIFIIIYLANICCLKRDIAILALIGTILFGTYSFTIGTKNAGIRTIPYVFYWENYFEINPDARNLYLY